MLADFFAEIEGSGGPSLTAAEHRMLAAGTDHDEPGVKQRSGELGEVDTERAVRRAALDEMAQIAEGAGIRACCTPQTDAVIGLRTGRHSASHDDASLSTFKGLRRNSWGDVIGFVLGFRLERQ